MFGWDRRTQIVVLVLVGALLFGAGVKYTQLNSQKSSEEIIVGNPSHGNGNAVEKPGDSSGKIFVHVAGAVENPGVYSFNSGARVNDAVNAAVPLPEADLDSLNLAALLKDGEKIIVGERELFKESEGEISGTQDQRDTDSSSMESGKININKATLEELDMLPGIGPAYGERIIDYREKSGGFKSIEEIMDVPGIGPKTFEKIKDQITVN
ncbi:MAG TPA: competence protein ComEA [Peptococcaceae bacterium]|nr:MAG: Competence protein ComEA helix-hairpin-helix region [Clostridia bacterium 41_269]HBT20330.1 competence protein ComEA [Peptococcaceae bacterium]